MSLKEKTQLCFANAFGYLCHSHHSGVRPREFDCEHTDYNDGFVLPLRD